jgi:hypothetical protein
MARRCLRKGLEGAEGAFSELEVPKRPEPRKARFFRACPKKCARIKF